jgi:hypothetical protein
LAAIEIHRFRRDVGVSEIGIFASGHVDSAGFLLAPHSVTTISSAAEAQL